LPLINHGLILVNASPPDAAILFIPVRAAPRLFTCVPPLLIIYILIMTFLNAPSFDFYFGQKNIKNNFDQRHNRPFAWKQLISGAGVPNRTSCSTNSMVELLYGRVHGAELQKLEWSSSKTPP